MLWDGEKCLADPSSGRSIDLIRLPDSTYEIRETVVEIRAVRAAEPLIHISTKAIVLMRRFHTMLTEVVAVDTNRGPIRLELDSELQVQQLFDVTGRFYLTSKVSFGKYLSTYTFNRDNMMFEFRHLIAVLFVQSVGGI